MKWFGFGIAMIGIWGGCAASVCIGHAQEGIFVAALFATLFVSIAVAQSE